MGIWGAAGGSPLTSEWQRDFLIKWILSMGEGENLIQLSCPNGWTNIYWLKVTSDRGFQQLEIILLRLNMAVHTPKVWGPGHEHFLQNFPKWRKSNPSRYLLWESFPKDRKVLWSCLMAPEQWEITRYSKLSTEPGCEKELDGSSLNSLCDLGQISEFRQLPRLQT